MTKSSTKSNGLKQRRSGQKTSVHPRGLKKIRSTYVSPTCSCAPKMESSVTVLQIREQEPQIQAKFWGPDFSTKITALDQLLKPSFNPLISPTVYGNLFVRKPYGDQRNVTVYPRAVPWQSSPHTRLPQDQHAPSMVLSVSAGLILQF